jgi:choline dehydrogenase
MGVEFTADKEGGKGATHRAYAAQEVVLCAGAVHTPHLLQLSGIGPAEHLAAHHIAVKVDLPGVGAGLEDHATVMTLWRDKTGHSLNYARRQGVVDVMRTTWNLGRWLITGGGPCASNARTLKVCAASV